MRYTTVPIEAAHSAGQQLEVAVQMITSVGGPTGDRLIAEALAIGADLDAIASRMTGLRDDLQETANRILQGYA